MKRPPKTLGAVLAAAETARSRSDRKRGQTSSTTFLRRPRALSLALVLALVAGAIAFLATAAQAQEPTGATATKDCPNAPLNDPYTIGDTVTCTATFVNDGFFPATVTLLTETAPFVAVGSPANGAPIDVECTLPDGTTVINEGDTLAPGVVCTGTFGVTIPNDPALCNTAFRDRVDIELEYPQFTPPLTAGAFATHTLLVVCQPTITVTKVADELSKVGDPVNYTIEVCNTGLITVTRQSVIDSLLGNISASFDATLAPGACDSAQVSRTVQPGDPDPLVNTVTATYTAGIQTATAMASDTTNLFQPDVDVTKNCSPDPIQVGQAETCTIVVTNSSSGDSPALVNGTITDTLTGNLLDPANTAVVSTTCAATLPTGGSCTINTTRVVLASDPSPLANTVTVHYNPSGFPNDITASATDSVIIEAPPGGEGCTPGFWKQPQHFDSWVGFLTTQTFNDVFGVNVTLSTGGNDATLLEALQSGGGGINALARHAVAALLNASSPDVDSDFTTAEVIALVQDAVASGDFETAKNLLAASNEAGCPLS
jgi:uncharacterized repeat protein (TIGR01451 family)